MTSLFDKLNLRPQERRLIMVTFVVIFVVLNVWLVFPYFDDWKDLTAKLRDAEQKEIQYQQTIGMAKDYENKLAKLRSEASLVVADDQGLALVQTIQTEAAAANIQIQRLTPQGGGPIPNNPFFEEQRVNINAVAGEGELVSFLQRIGSGNSLIRVRDMNLRPDQSGHKLLVDLTIVGNYQKKPESKPAAPGSGPAPRDGRQTGRTEPGKSQQ